MVIDAVREGKKVVRLQPGDPSLFGSLAKQLNRFEQEGIPLEVIPGVPVGFAAACSLRFDLTLPGFEDAAETVCLDYGLSRLRTHPRKFWCMRQPRRG